MSTSLYFQERSSGRKQEGKKGPDIPTLVGEAKARQKQVHFSEVLGVILLPHTLGAPAPESCGYPVAGYVDASAHTVREIGPGVLEGCLHCCASGSLAPRRESAPTVRRTGLCRYVSSSGHPRSSVSPGAAHLFPLLPVGQAPQRILRAQTAQVTASESVGWLRSDLL